MRLAVVTPVFPSELDAPSRGAGIGAVTLIQGMQALRPDLDVHVVHYRTRRPQSERVLGDPPFTVHTLPGSRLARAAPTPRVAQAEVARVLRRLQPDVVHVRGTASFVDGARWPAVLSVHGITEREVRLSGIPGARVRALLHQLREPPSRARYAHIIAIVGYVAQALETQLTGRVHYVPNSIDPRFFDVAGPRTGTAPLIVHAGDICPIKNAMATVEAVGILAARGVDCRLRLLGKCTVPAYGEQVAARIDALGLRDRVDVPGRIGRTEMLAELAAARVLSLPSYVEVAPLTIAEASAVGVPAVVSPAGGSAEMVVDRHSGRLVPPSSPDALADALQPLLEDVELATLWGQRARTIAERHRPEAVAAGTLGVYQAILAG